MIHSEQLVHDAIIPLRTKGRCVRLGAYRQTHQRRRKKRCRSADEMAESHVCLLCSARETLHAPGLLAYAEQHRWVCWGMGAVSSQIKLWVGGPIAIHRTST